MQYSVPPYGPWGQPHPTQPTSPYSAPMPQPQPVQPDPLARVMPLIQQADYLRPRLTAGQLAILHVIAAVGQRTNSHPYFPSADEQGDMQMLRQLQAVEPRGEGYLLTPLGDALIVAERLARMMALA